MTEQGSNDGTKYPNEFEMYGRSVVRVVRITDDRDITIIGTAFCIGWTSESMAVFLTASHVVRKYEADERVRLAVLAHPQDLPPAVAADEPVPVEPVLMPIIGFGIRDDHNDITALSVDIRNRKPALALDAGPQIDDEGNPYFHMEARLSPGPEPHLLGLEGFRLREPPIDLDCTAVGFGGPEGQLIEVRGTVRTVHGAQRDSSFITYPSVQVEAHYPERLSGGPIFDSEGRIFAVVSTGYELQLPAPPLAYGALVIAAAELPVMDESGAEPTLVAGQVMSNLDIGAKEAFINYSNDVGGLSVRWVPPDDEPSAEAGD